MFIKFTPDMATLVSDPDAYTRDMLNRAVPPEPEPLMFMGMKVVDDRSVPKGRVRLRFDDRAAGAIERALEQALPGMAVSVTPPAPAGHYDPLDWGPARITVRPSLHVMSNDSTGVFGAPKAKPEPTEEDKALHRALSRSKGTFSRENQCGWIGDE